MVVFQGRGGGREGGREGGRKVRESERREMPFSISFPSPREGGKDARLSRTHVLTRLNANTGKGQWRVYLGGKAGHLPCRARGTSSLLPSLPPFLLPSISVIHSFSFPPFLPPPLPQAFQDKIQVPLIAHNRWWSVETPYASQVGREGGREGREGGREGLPKQDSSAPHCAQPVVVRRDALR